GLGLFDNFERQSVDARFSVRGDRSQPKDVIVVGIDGKTFSDLNVQWPFPRSLHARVIDAIAKDDPRVIAYDVQFSEDSPPAQDNALYLALKRHPGKVVLATTEVDPKTHEPNTIFDEVLGSLKDRVGSANFPSDAGNVIRRVPYKANGLEHFALVAAEVA